MVNLGSAYGEIQIGTGGAEQNVASLADKLRSTGQAMSLALTAPLVGLAATGAMAAADFEQSLNTMESVSGATAEQMQALSDTALQLGADTSFSAGQAAEGMLELGKAGMSTEDVLDSIAGTLDLAAAGEMSVAQAAETSANVLNTFGLQASEAGRIADLLAASANSSSVEVTDMAASMQMAGAVFASNQVPVEDLSTAIALLGNNGIKGSDAGTSLKTMLMRLTAPTDEASAAMAGLGIEVYNADGTMRAFPEILASLQQAMTGTNAVTVTSSNLTGEQSDRMDYLGKTIARTQRSIADYQSGVVGATLDDEKRAQKLAELNQVLVNAQAEYSGLAGAGSTTSTVMRQLTEEQRNQALATIFGADAIRAANILLAEGTDGYAAMKEQVTQVGVAQQVADAKLKGLAGAIEYAKGTIESTLISAILPFMDGMSGMIRQGADLIGMFTSLPAPVQNAALAFAAVLAAAGPLMLAISGIGAALGFLLSPIGLVVVGVAALAAAWSANFLGIQEATAAAWAVIQPAVDGFILALQSLGLYIQAVVEDGDYLNDWLTHLPEFMQAPVLAFGQMVAAFRNGFAGLSVSAAESGTMYAAFRSQIDETLGAAQNAWQSLMTLLEPALTRLQTAFTTTGTQVAALGPHFDALWLAIQNMWTAVQPIVQALGALIGAEIAITAVVAVNLLAQTFSILGTVAGVVIDQITLALNTFAALITEVVTLVKALIDGDYTAAWQSAQNIVQIFANFWKRTFDNMRLLVVEVFTAIQTAVLDTLKDLDVDGGALMRTIQGWWNSIWGGFMGVIQPVVDGVNGLLGALQSLGGLNITPPWAGWGPPPDWWNPGTWFGGGGQPAAPGQNAMGTSYWRGGLTWVGERGPELIDVPRGARIYDNADSQRMAGGGVTVNVPVQQVGSQLDVTELAYRVAGVIMQYGYGGA